MKVAKIGSMLVIRILELLIQFHLFVSQSLVRAIVRIHTILVITRSELTTVFLFSKSIMKRKIV